MATAEMKVKVSIDVEDSCLMLVLLKQIRRKEGTAHFLEFRTWLEDVVGLKAPAWLVELCEEG